MNNQITGSLSFQEKRDLQRLIVEQNKIISSEAVSAIEKDEANRVKAEALLKLGIVPVASNYS